MSRSYNSLKAVLALLHLHVVTVGSNVTVPQNILAICLQHCWVRSVLSLHLLSCSDFLCSLCSRTWFLMGILPSSFILFDLELHYKNISSSPTALAWCLPIAFTTGGRSWPLSATRYGIAWKIFLGWVGYGACTFFCLLKIFRDGLSSACRAAQTQRNADLPCAYLVVLVSLFSYLHYLIPVPSCPYLLP